MGSGAPGVFGVAGGRIVGVGVGLKTGVGTGGGSSPTQQGEQSVKGLPSKFKASKVEL